MASSARPQSRDSDRDSNGAHGGTGIYGGTTRAAGLRGDADMSNGAGGRHGTALRDRVGASGGAAPRNDAMARLDAYRRRGAGYDGPERPNLLQRLRKQDGDWGGPGHGNGDGGDGWDDGGGRDGKTPRVRRKGDWWRHWTWKKALGVVGATIGVFIIICAGGIAYAYSHTPIPDVNNAVTDSASTVYFSDGKTPVGKFGDVNRQILTYNQIPVVMREAMVAAEDKNFYHEGGISFGGILRAAYYDLTSSSNSLQGASTLTQQLVRNYYVNIGSSQTLSRKIKEIFVSEKLASQESKAWILEHYLNTVYFGDGAYGVGAAAQVYFNEPVGKLTLAQAAMLAAMPQSPSYYTPNPKGGAAYSALAFRFKYVLGAMASMNYISQQTASSTKFPTTAPPFNNNWGHYYGYIMEKVQYEMATTYFHDTSQQAGTRLSTAGLKIYTTYSKPLTDALYATVDQNLRYMKQCSAATNSPTTLVGGGDPGTAIGYPCKSLPSWVHTGAVLTDPKTGDILAEYGGPSYSKNNFDYALASYNQVGSSFKPYVLAAAIKDGMNAYTSILNGISPLWIPPVGSPPNVYPKPGNQPPAGTTSWFQVTNDEAQQNQGPVSSQKAMAMSLNTAFTSLYSRVSGAKVMAMAQQFGVYTGPGTAMGQSYEDYVGEALGQGSLTVQEQATMIATIANNGVYVTPHVISKYVTAAGGVVSALVQHRQVLTLSQATEMDWAMSQDFTQGLGTAPGDALPNGQPVIAKTGTTNLAQSAFFLGATPKYAMAIGMFVSKPTCPKRLQNACAAKGSLSYAPPAGIQTLFGVGGTAGYGGGWPATIWHDYFVKEFNNVPVQQFPQPPPNMADPSLGTKWNLVGALPKPKKHHQQGQGNGHHGCGPWGGGNGNGNGHGHGGGGGFVGNSGSPNPCNTPSPTPTPTATPTGSPTPTPTPSNTHSPGPGLAPPRSGLATPRGSAAESVALGAVPILGALALGAFPFAEWSRQRRRRQHH
ncbi:MAG TPA: transglycosylase domain-containing protein [Streptosporangiaceae bacterium]|nr:transglycosylase domain-containing protein [Streptosporangiaceae bacterium]